MNEASESSDEETQLGYFSGSGNNKTKPFSVPSEAIYFTIRWTMEDDGQIDLFSIEDPNESIESLSGHGPSES